MRNRFNIVIDFKTDYTLHSLFSSHPSTIKKRFLSVFIMMFISPLFLYFAIDKSILQRVTSFICKRPRYVLTLVFQDYFAGTVGVQVERNSSSNIHASISNNGSLSWTSCNQRLYRIIKVIFRYHL